MNLVVLCYDIVGWVSIELSSQMTHNVELVVKPYCTYTFSSLFVVGFVEESAFLGEYHTVDQTGQSGKHTTCQFCRLFLQIILHFDVSTVDDLNLFFKSNQIYWFQ